MKSHPLLTLITLLVLPAASHAACSRADVDHFLSRGFSQEQVVLLCGGEAQEPVPGALEKVDEERSLREMLLSSVDTPELDLAADRLGWVARACVEYAPPNLAGRQRERCGTVQRSVLRADLQVEDIHRKILFFGEHGLMVSGPVQQRWEVDLSELSPSDQARAKEKMPAVAPKALLPLHDSADLKAVAAALERWSGRE